MSVKTDSILDKDLYELIGVLQNASVKEIKTAYRKKALECHPDKNPDNPKANELFLELSRALAVLIDEPARAAYDKVLNAKLAAKKRTEVLDSKRKKFKEELEERERLAQERDTSYDIKASQAKFEQELERLRKLSSKQVEEELNYVRNMMKERKAKQEDSMDNTVYRLKIKWSSAKSEEGGYTSQTLHQIFSKYGSVNAIALSVKKSRSALIEFLDKNAAVNAFRLEKGLVSNPLSISWVGPPPPQVDLMSKCDSRNIYGSSFKEAGLKFNPSPAAAVEENDDDFELSVLKKLREAERKKNTNS